MTKLNSDTAPEYGKGTDADRLSQSPQEIRRGSAEYTDIGPRRGDEGEYFGRPCPRPYVLRHSATNVT